MKRLGLRAETYPIIHAKRLIARLFHVIPAVQPSGIGRRFAQFLPHRVFARTVEVTETPSRKAVGLGGRFAPLHRSGGTLNRADKGYDRKEKKK